MIALLAANGHIVRSDHPELLKVVASVGFGCGVVALFIVLSILARGK